MDIAARKPIKLPVTEKMLTHWAGERVFDEGKKLFQSGAVQSVVYDHPSVRGVLSYGSRELRTSFVLAEDLSVENQCPCRDNRERGLICSHLIAIAYACIVRQSDPERLRKALEEQRRAERLEQYQEADYLNRVSADHPRALPASLALSLNADWPEQALKGAVALTIRIRVEGQEQTPESIDPATPLTFREAEEALLFVLEDIAEGPVRGDLQLSLSDFLNVLRLRAGQAFCIAGQEEMVRVNDIEMTPVLRMEMDPENGELILMIHTELPFMDSSRFPVYLIQGKTGWIYDAGHFWKLDRVLPGPLQAVYHKPIVVERPSVHRFLQTELPLIQAHIAVETELSADLFSYQPAEPRFQLILRGSPASVAGELLAEYGNGAYTLVAGRADAEGSFSLPDPDDFLRYLVRNPERETIALAQLADSGMNGEQGDQLSAIVGSREVLNFLGSQVPRLRRLGWKIVFEGRIEPFMEEADFVTPVVDIRRPQSGANWFEVEFDFEDTTGASFRAADIQRALRRGESFIQRDGRTLLLDGDAIERAQDVFEDCESREGGQAGSFHLNDLYASYVKDSLDALDGIDVDADPAWMQVARRQNRTTEPETEALPPALEQALRPYQKDGVFWMRFLEANRFGGILADEMGLGKTLQTLTWLTLARKETSAQNLPALIVCPTSLVENWQDEANKWTPQLKVLLMQGGDRHQHWDTLDRYDLTITSYALMRRDAETYAQQEFSALILDEAQHIKNRSTQNAVAAKSLRAVHRLVLTGTPLENSVADLWSIMDFLMPGYLGGYKRFRERYELPMQNGGTDAEYASKKLRRKIHPFLLRRLKSEVAKDLPPKIQRLATCSLSPDQAAVYRHLADQAKRRLQDLVGRQGFQRSRMEVLKILMQLRQTCCHLELLKLESLEAKRPSAKMELFFELVDEAIDGGHRILVFSQFTRMLGILRRHLEERGINYRYLDGQTKERLKLVREFNTDTSISLFLISLKAGGTGLNLTGADMVIHYDPWWNPAVEDQATDRAYRIGQKKTVYGIKLITKGTVEEKVVAMQEKKRALYDAALSSDEEAAGKLTWEDVQDLLNY